MKKILNFIKKYLDYKNLSQLKKNVLSGMICASVNVLLLLISYPVFLHYLGSELYGLWVILSVIVIFSQMGDLGINNTLMKFIAEEYGKKNYKRIMYFISTAVMLMFGLSVFIIFFLVILRVPIASFLNLGEYKSLAVTLIPLMGLHAMVIIFTNLFKGSVGGLGRLDISNYTFLGARVIGLSTSVALIVAGFGIWGLYFGVLLSHLLSFFVYIYIIKRHKIQIFSFKGFRKDVFKELFFFGGTLTGSKVLRMLLDPFNKVIISKYIGLEEVTYYEIAFKGLRQIKSIFQQSIQPIMPKISEVYGKYSQPMVYVNNIYKKTTIGLIALSLPVLLLLFTFGEVLLKIWLENNYNLNVLIALQILIIGFLFEILSLPARFVLMAEKKVNILFYSILLRVFVNILSVFLLLFFWKVNYGLIAWITSLGFVISAIYIWLKYYTRLKQKI